MRVIVATNMYPTPESPSFGIFVKEQVEDLVALGFEIDLLAFDGRARRSEYARAAARLRRVARSGRHQLVHAHYGLTGAMALMQRSLPVVTTFHGGDFTGLSRWQRQVSRIAARFTTPIFVSPAGRGGLGQPHAHVIPAGVDTARFTPRPRDEARSVLGWPGDTTYVLFPGARALPNKRADLFDSALEHVRHHIPGVVGVELVGYSRDEVATVMNAVDVTVMTSDFEGSPVAIRESLACMTPVVSVPVGDVAHVIDGLPGCSVVARQPDAIARGIVSALEVPRAPELRARAEESSRRRVAQRVAAVYETVAGR